MLKRQAEDRLVTWFNSSRRKPLVLRGARQVGKSTLIESFSRKSGMNLLTVNCEKNRQLDSVFETLDVVRILNEVEATANKGAINSQSLLFLDEIQATPNALPALRYLYEERSDLAVIAAGSLLEFALSEHQFSMPVGRIQYLHMGPLSFREFVQAVEPERIAYLDELNPDSSMPEAAHRSLCALQRNYLFTGGMPEAVAVYQATGSLSEVRNVHKEIVETYVDDFAKYARNKDLALLQRIFSSIPRLLGQKIKYVNLVDGERAAHVRALIELLIKAQVVLPIWHSHCSGIPLGANIDASVFKLAFLDVGLANHLCGVDWQYLANSENLRLVNEGGIAEQHVAQQLAWLGDGKPELTYWHNESRSSNAEVDFTHAFGMDIYPIEVKAGKSGSLKSLQQFMLKKGSGRAIRFDLNQASRQMMDQRARTKEGSENISYELISLPLYAVEELPRIVNCC